MYMLHQKNFFSTHVLIPLFGGSISMGSESRGLGEVREEFQQRNERRADEEWMGGNCEQITILLLSHS